MKKNAIYRNGGLKTQKCQKAYILILTIVLLLATLIASISFFEQSADSLQISGYNRDSSESLLLAESAMNMLYGQFVFNKSLNGNNIPDNEERVDIDNPESLPLQYSYFVTSGVQIDQEKPSLLQRIANGEARNNGSAGINHSFNVGQTELLIENLYTDAGASPIVFQFNAQNELIISEEDWDDIPTTNTKAAVAWLELVRNPELSGTIQVYVQAAARVNNSKSYVQRLIGEFNSTLSDEIFTVSGANLTHQSE